ncbi:glycosyltransferase family 4 protein [Nanoarchaeota archaeon]
MNLCHTTEFFFPEEGGVERHIYYLSQEMFSRSKDYTISVVTSNRAHTGKVITPSSEKIAGIDVYRQKTLFQMHFWNYFPSMVKQLEKIMPDIVHAHAYRHPHVALSAKFAKKHNKKLVFTPYAIFPGNAQLPLKNRIYYPIYDTLFIKSIFKKTDAVIALTHFEKDELIKRGVDKNKISVIPCGGYSFDPINESTLPEADLNKIFNENKGKFIIGALSRIHPSKGVDVLIKALAEIKDEDFLFIFGGKDFGCLKDLLRLAEDLGISDKVKYIGFVNKSKKFFYENLDLFVSPSKAEALGMTLVEAQACGVPVIGSNFGPIRETMLDNVTGYLVNYGDYKTLAAKIKDLIHDDTKRKEFATKSMKRASYFSWKNLTDCILKVYNGEKADLYSMIKL